VRVWDLATYQELQTFSQTGEIRAVAFHPSNANRLVSASADKTVAIHTMNLGRVVSVGHPLRALAVAANGSHLFTGGQDGSVKMWNTSTGVVERTFAGGPQPALAVAVAKNNLFLAAGGLDQSVRLFNITDGKLVTTLKAPGEVHGLSFTPNSQTLVAACENLGARERAGTSSIQMWNVAFTPGQPPPAEFTRPMQNYPVSGGVTDVVFAANGVNFYSSGGDKTVKAWKIAADTPTKTLGHPNIVDGVAFNPAGTLLATVGHDGNLRLFDVAKGAQVREINAHTAPAVQPIYCVAWTPDGKQVLSGSMDGSLKLWDATAGTLVREFKAYKEKTFEKGHRDPIYSAGFSPDGKQLASGSDGVIKIWNVSDGNVLRDLTNPQLKAGPAPATSPAHPGWVYGVRFTPDGKHLVSVGGAPNRSGTLALWNAADGKLLRAETRPIGTLFSLSLSSDGRLLALGSGGGAGTAQELNNGFVVKLPASQ
jgi:WD40 repeat protein